jgi:hypothetical protein
MTSDDQPQGRDGGIAKAVTTTAAALTAGVVLTGIVGAVAVGGIVGWLSYKRWIEPRQQT